MNGSELKYNREYVEIQTALEHIRTKLESIESGVGMIYQELDALSTQSAKNAADITTIKSTAGIIGGIAGSCIALFTQWFFPGKP
jgi:chromosome segregation ATPase